MSPFKADGRRMEKPVQNKKRWKAAVLTAALSMGVWGCQGVGGGYDFQPETSSIYVSEDGKIQSATVENYDKDYYSQSGLEEFLAGQVAAYNKSLGAAELGHNIEGGQTLPAAVVSCSLEEGIAAVIYEYANSESFLDFAEEFHDADNLVSDFKTGTAAEARTEGWLEGMDFVKPGKGQEAADASADEISRLSDQQAVLVETDHPITLETGGRIRYMTRGVSLQDRNTAQIPEGTHVIIFK